MAGAQPGLRSSLIIMAFTYEYPRPALAVDCVVFAIDNNQLKVLLIERCDDPYQGHWALPGGFVDMDETVDQAAARELQEETCLKKIFLEQLYTFSQVDRDPRSRVVSVAYYALVKFSEQHAVPASDAKRAEWFDTKKLPKLAFDHDHIMDVAIDRLQGKVRYQPIGFELLPTRFTLSELQSVYETILDQELDKRNFRRKFLAMDVLTELDEVQSGVAHRAAKLYKFDEKKYRARIQSGFNYWI